MITRFKRTGFSLSLLMCLQLLTLGCAEDKTDESSNSENMGWLIRKATPQSDFAPTGIENVIDNLTTALNDSEQQVGMKAVFMPKTIGGFFEDSVLGANRAFAELSLLGTMAAPPDNDNSDGNIEAEMQVVLFAEQLNEGVFLYGIAPNSPDIVEQIDAAVNAGGVVVTFDSDKSESLRQFYIGTNNPEAGRIAGATMDGLIGAGTTGTVVILGYDDESWEDGYSRTQEARKVLEGEGHTVAVLHTDWASHETNIAAIQEVLDTAAPPVVGCLGVFNNSFACGDAVVAAGKQGVVKVAAFDAEPQTLLYMNDGVIQATHTQRVYYMGYLVPYVLYAVHNLGIEKTMEILAPLMIDAHRIDTGLDVIPADKIGDYDAFMDKLNAL